MRPQDSHTLQHNAPQLTLTCLEGKSVFVFNVYGIIAHLGKALHSYRRSERFCRDNSKADGW